MAAIMKGYTAFLRGINISGKNRIPMAKLKEGFEEIGFCEVRTYLNSGNVIFSSAEDDSGGFANRIETMIGNRFDFDIPAFLISQEALEEILLNAPDWWGGESREIYDNLIFIMPPYTFAEVLSEIGEPRIEFERIKDFRNAIFWSFSRKDYQKTNWWSKTASMDIGKKLTIRTAGTVRKVAELRQGC